LDRRATVAQPSSTRRWGSAGHADRGAAPADDCPTRSADSLGCPDGASFGIVPGFLKKRAPVLEERTGVSSRTGRRFFKKRSPFL
jgi:hypothetical protein